MQLATYITCIVSRRKLVKKERVGFLASTENGEMSAVLSVGIVSCLLGELWLGVLPAWLSECPRWRV